VSSGLQSQSGLLDYQRPPASSRVCLGFGGLQVLSIILSIVSGIVHLFGFISIVGYLVGLFAFIMWIVCLYKAWSGGGARFEIPLVGGVVTPYAEQIANSVN